MGIVKFQDGAIQIEAGIIAEGLGIDPSVVQERMREGKITSRCERGVDEDEGRHRLTFFTENRRFRVVIDASGNVVRRSVIDTSDRPLPAALRNPGSR